MNSKRCKELRQVAMQLCKGSDDADIRKLYKLMKRQYKQLRRKGEIKY